MLTDQQTTTAISSLQQRFGNLVKESAGLTTTQTLVALAWALQAFNEKAVEAADRAFKASGAAGLGACQFTTSDGVNHCCNLTNDQCALIPGATFDSKNLCNPAM